MTLLLFNDLVAHLYEFMISLYGKSFSFFGHMGVGSLRCPKNDHVLQWFLNS